MASPSSGRVLVRQGIAAAVLGALAVAAAGPATRFGLWHFRTGLTSMRYAAYVALAGAALALVGGLLRGGWRGAVAGVLVGLAGAAGPWQFQRTARSVPPIHDITTDTEDPPPFRAVLPARAGAANPPEYPGAEVAAQQKRAYPDVQPLRLPDPPPVAFDRALATARVMRWEIVAAEREEGRIEATDTTPWFGFKDDVVVRIRPEGGGSRLDVRSKSRVGRSDVGANARRIRRFLERVSGPGR